MKKIILAGTALAALSSTPAFAEGPFQGVKVAAVAGYDDNNLGIDDASGFLYGASVGYDAQMGRAVIGAEAELTDSTASKFGVDAERDIYVGGRIGYAVTDSALLYAKAGYTNAQASDDIVTAKYDGMRVGAGLEYAMPGNLFVRGEYRYSNYELDAERHQAVMAIGMRF